jgi:hypothetical protein
MTGSPESGGAEQQQRADDRIDAELALIAAIMP